MLYSPGIVGRSSSWTLRASLSTSELVNPSKETPLVFIAFSKINCLLNKNHKSTSVDFIKTDAADVSDNQKISELLNEYFSNIGKILSDQITDPNGQEFKQFMQVSETFTFSAINSTTVHNELRNLSS